jgi:hypothetical protein
VSTEAGELQHASTRGGQTKTTEGVPVLYDRPVSQLMKDAASEMPDQFAPTDVVAWFRERYPNVKEGTVRAHVIGLTANDSSRGIIAGSPRRRLCSSNSTAAC